MKNLQVRKFKNKGKAIVSQNPFVEVKRVPIDSIKLWNKNPRKNEKAVKPLAELLKVHGQQTPIVVWEKDNQIYKGNTTWKAAKYLKWDYIWVAFSHFKDEKQAIGYALADNKASEWSDWDDSILAMLLPEKMGANMTEIAELTGFKEKDLAGFFAAEDNQLPDDLKEVDIYGGSFDEKADYLVIQFPDHKSMDDFKNRLKSKTAHPRVLTYEMLMESMEWREPADAEGAGVSSSGKIDKIKFKIKGKTLKRRVR